MRVEYSIEEDPSGPTYVEKHTHHTDGALTVEKIKLVPEMAEHIYCFLSTRPNTEVRTDKYPKRSW